MSSAAMMLSAGNVPSAAAQTDYVLAEGVMKTVSWGGGIYSADLRFDLDSPGFVYVGVTVSGIDSCLMLWASRTAPARYSMLGLQSPARCMADSPFSLGHTISTFSRMAITAFHPLASDSITIRLLLTTWYTK